MSGQTIRDVVIRMAIEMAQTNLRVPDFSEHKRAVDDFERHVRDKVASINSHWESVRGNGRFSGSSGGSSGGHTAAPSVSSSTVGDGLDDIRGMFAQLKTSASSLAAESKAVGAATAEAGAGVRGLVSALAALPPQAQLAVAAVALVGATVGGYNAYGKFNREYMSSQLNPEELSHRGINVSHMGIENAVQRDMASGTPFQFQMPNGASMRPETLMESWGRKAWGGVQAFSDMFTGLGAEDDLRETYNKLANEQLKQSRQREMKLTGQDIHSENVLLSGREQQSALSRQFGFTTTRDQLRDLGTRESEHASWMETEQKKPGVIGGARAYQLDAEGARAGVDFAKQRLQIQQQLVAELEHEKNSYGNILQSAQQTLQYEKERLREDKERLGSASGQDLARLNKIGEKLEQGGALNEQEAKLAAHYGLQGADNQVGKFFENRFNKKISDKAQRGFGLGNKVEAAEGNLKSARQNYDDAAPEIEGEIGNLQESSQKIIEKLPEMLKAQDDANRAMVEALQAIAKGYQIMEQQTKNGMQSRNGLGF